MAEHFTNSIGCLQQTAIPSSFHGFDKVSASPTNQPQEGMQMLHSIKRLDVMSSERSRAVYLHSLSLLQIFFVIFIMWISQLFSFFKWFWWKGLMSFEQQNDHFFVTAKSYLFDTENPWCQHSLLSDFALLFAQLIARTAKDIDYLIDHLPNEESSMDLQVKH